MGEITLSVIYPDAGNAPVYSSISLRIRTRSQDVRKPRLINNLQVNHYVDITETFERKVAVVQLILVFHKSVRPFQELTHCRNFAVRFQAEAEVTEVARSLA